MPRNWAFTGCFLGVACGVSFAQTPDPASHILKPPIAPSLHGRTFSTTAVGDLLGLDRSITPLKGAEFEKVSALPRGPDIANDEGAGFNLKNFNGAAAQNGGGKPPNNLQSDTDFKAIGLTARISISKTPLALFACQPRIDAAEAVGLLGGI